ncbi:MAG: hypothetical protein COW67_00805 [Flavobacteriales bacterium CG18_big_fil_WC_8_21_14_2_50_32_9]|nr:MAG: hypothetical protein COW67_00805 [Flavobacteriales bacterium CG18_big_fil_WC_8_21_14_2_50_32_9]PIZ06316.1 MAG: hypothetical protein COY57_02655 [Flavobacteriales bacterium CG_4_10_14_0_8_um_filter_32_5]
MEENKKNKSASAIGGVVFAGCLFVGAGIGMLANATQVGGALGMGVGFIAMGIIWAYYRNK